MRKLIFLLFLTIVYFVYGILVDAGVFRTIVSHGQDNVVQMYEQAAGTEDMQIDHATGVMFISSTDRWAAKKGQPIEGGIYKLLLDDSVSVPAPIPHTYKGGFYPHGLSLLKENNQTLLYVVNHNDKGDFVEKFNYLNDTLFHFQSFSSPQMCCPNDLVAVSEDRFYVSNDHGFPTGFMRKLEDYLKLPKSSILYYDGSDFSTAFTGLSYANGVNISQDKQTLYATHTTGQELLTFKIDKQGGLLLKEKLHLATGVDNINVAPNGDLWIGAHPKMLDFVGHASNPSHYSPSQVLRVFETASNGYQVEEVFLDDGQLISGSSVALPYQNHLYVGVVFENKLLKLRLKSK